MASSNKTIPKKDPLRESNQNFNTTQGIRSGTHLLAFQNQQDIKMKTSNLTNIGQYSKPTHAHHQMNNNMHSNEGRYKKKQDGAQH